METILNRLREIGNHDAENGRNYQVQYAKLNAMHYGNPQNRPRVYIVGVHFNCIKHAFTYPPRQPPVFSDQVLDPIDREATMNHKPHTDTAQKNHERVMAKLTRLG